MGFAGRSHPPSCCTHHPPPRPGAGVAAAAVLEPRGTPPQPWALTDPQLRPFYLGSSSSASHLIYTPGSERAGHLSRFILVRHGLVQHISSYQCPSPSSTSDQIPGDTGYRGLGHCRPFSGHAHWQSYQRCSHMDATDLPNPKPFFMIKPRERWPSSQLRVSHLK